MTPISAATTKNQSDFRTHAADLSASIVRARGAQDKLDAIKQKYSSLDALAKDQKIEKLKDLSTNPHFMANPRDSLANSYHRWTVLAQQAEGKDPKQKAQIASNYYDREIAPYYQKLQADVMPKDAWMKEAFGAAKTYQIEHDYKGDDTSYGRALWKGFESGQGQIDRAAVFATNMLGMAVHTGNDLIRGLQLIAPGRPGEDPKLVTAWHNSLLHMQASDIAKYGGKNFIDTASAITKDIPSLAAAQKFFQRDSATSAFWEHVDPSKGIKEGAVSMVAEAATTLPLFEGLGATTKALIPGAKAIPYIENLTNALDKIPGGKMIAGALTAGSEGLAYGTLTRENKDKSKAWQDALSFAAMHTVFHVAGELGSGAKDTLINRVKASGNKSVIDKLDEQQEKLELMVTKNERPANAAEKYDAHVGEVSNNLSVVGTLGQKSIIEEAWNHVKEQQEAGLGRKEVQEQHAKMMQEDPARHGPVLSTASYLRDLLKDRKLSDIKEGSKDYKFIQDKLSKLVLDAQESLDRYVEPIQNQTKQKALQLADGKSAARALNAIVQKLTKEVKESGVNIPPEKILEKAKQEYAEANVKGAVRASKARNAKPLDEATAVAKKRRDTVDPGVYKERTKFTVNKKGEPAVSYSFNKEYKSYLESKVPSLKSGELKAFYKYMEPSNFNEDLKDHFYPEDLAEAGIYFETESTREGENNPNFLAFMYNYKDQMPEELGDELARRLEDTPKFEKFFKKSKDIESQLRFYALQMYNHVDDFLASGRHPKETNVFRSTQSDLLNPTIYQKKLLEEREVQEQKNIKNMFREGPNRDAALATWQVFSNQRKTQFALPPTMNRALKIRQLSDEIDSQITSDGNFVPWRF